MTGDAAERYWTAWLQDYDRSERQLRNYTLTLVRAGHRAAQESDFVLLQSIYSAYLEGAAHCRQEPYLSTFETGKFMLQLTIADSCVLNGRPAQGWRLAEEVLDWLKAADERRAALKLPARPNSEIRVTALGIQAMAFYEDPDVDTAENMLSTVKNFWSSAETFWENMKRPSISASYRSAMQQLTAIYELEVCKACLHLGSEFAENAVEQFNRRHGQELAAGLAHFRQLDERAAPTSFYWDYEYAKLRASGAGTEPELRLCAEQRLKGARLRFGSATLEVLDRYWKAERLSRRY